MLTVISPAKRLDPAPPALPEGIAASDPAFAAAAGDLAQIARGLSAAELRKLMDISPALAELNLGRFAAFGTQDRAPAALLFAGCTKKPTRPAPSPTSSAAPVCSGWSSSCAVTRATRRWCSPSSRPAPMTPGWSR